MTVRHTLEHHLMYIPNFNYLAQFRGKLREEQTKNKKNQPKNHIVGAVKKCNETENSRPSKDTSKVLT